VTVIQAVEQSGSEQRPLAHGLWIAYSLCDIQDWMEDRRMSRQQRIIVDPNILIEKPVIKGTRPAVEFIVGLLAEDWSERYYRQFPY
jgi:hypothetical protein